MRTLIFIILSFLAVSVQAQTTYSAELERRARAGDVEAQVKLGNCYYDGNGVPKDDFKAAEWIRKAANQGYAEAQVELGNCYFFGIGVQQDYTKAVKLYLKAANQGLDRAQCNLGICYASGKGVPQNNSKAIEWYQKAANQGNEKAKEYLANMQRMMPPSDTTTIDNTPNGLIATVRRFEALMKRWIRTNSVSDRDNVEAMLKKDDYECRLAEGIALRINVQMDQNGDVMLATYLNYIEELIPYQLTFDIVDPEVKTREGITYVFAWVTYTWKQPRGNDIRLTQLCGFRITDGIITSIAYDATEEMLRRAANRIDN